MDRVDILHFSDVLCVWAYVAEQRLAELDRTFGAAVSVRYHYLPVFSDVAGKMERGWGHRGGIAAYEDHVIQTAAAFPHVEVRPGCFAEVQPKSSLGAHLWLAAAREAEAEGELPGGAAWRLASRFRVGFFAEGADVSQRPVQRRLTAELGLDPAELDRRIEDGRAHAALGRDLDLAREHEVRISPTLLLDGGRQRLQGNVGYRVIEATVRELLSASPRGASWC